MRRYIKIIVLAIISIATFSMVNMDFMEVHAAQADEMSYVRVGLYYGSTAKSSYKIAAKEGFIIAEKGSKEQYSEIENIEDYSELEIVYDGSNISIVSYENEIVLESFDDSKVILPIGYESDATIKIEGKSYRGGLAFSENDSTINAINVLKMDHYLYGVLNSEMGYTAHIEALKAQAVTARSFAMTNLDRHGDFGFDVCTSTHCQVYKGYTDEHESTNKAVDETSGIAMYYGGKAAVGYYYKNSGGHTQSCKEVWGSDVKYLIGIEDEYSPSYPWTATFTFEEIESKLNSKGYKIGDLKNITVSARNSAGAVDTLTFEGTAGKAEIKRDNIRGIFGATVIKSTHFIIENSSSNASHSDSTINKGNDTLENLKTLFVQGREKVENLSSSIYVMGRDESVNKQNPNNLYATSGGNTVKLQLDEESKAESEIIDDSTSSDDVNSKVTFNGYGYGHGIGMPQDSAMEMAKQGFTFDAILKYYYTGIDIR